MNAPVNQNDCRACEGWGCALCRPRAGEQADVELRERAEAIAAAVKEEREACARLVEDLDVNHEDDLISANEAAAAIRARSKP